MITRLLRPLATCLLAAGLLCASPALTAAQDAGGDTGADDTAASTGHPVRADYKGMVGMGLIGAELGFMLPAAAGARDPWVYIVFPVLGAGGGAVGGYYLLEQGSGEPELAVASLTLGMALIIPTMIVTMSATAYDPDSDRSSYASRRGGDGLLRVSDEGAVRLSAPAIAAGPSLSARESLRTGVPRDTEVRVSVLSGQF
jgi:hypothetical protein